MPEPVGALGEHAASRRWRRSRARGPARSRRAPGSPAAAAPGRRSASRWPPPRRQPVQRSKPISTRPSKAVKCSGRSGGAAPRSCGARYPPGRAATASSGGRALELPHDPEDRGLAAAPHAEGRHHPGQLERSRGRHRRATAEASGSDPVGEHAQRVLVGPAGPTGATRRVTPSPRRSSESSERTGPRIRSARSPEPAEDDPPGVVHHALGGPAGARHRRGLLARAGTHGPRPPSVPRCRVAPPGDASDRWPTLSRSPRYSSK